MQQFKNSKQVWEETYNVLNNLNMAILKLSGIIDKISGKLGGSILGTGPNGSYIKQNAWSQQHPSTQQSLHRTKVGLVTQNWRSVTPANKIAFGDAAIDYPYINKVGDEVLYTGFQLHNYLNGNIKILSGSLIVAPPIYVPPANPNILFITATPTSQVLQFTANAVKQGCGVYMTRGLPVNTTNPEGHFIMVYPFPAGYGNRLFDIAPWYRYYVETPAIGTRIFMTMKFIDPLTGINSGFRPHVSHIVTALP
jgi:hypothetical protein